MHLLFAHFYRFTSLRPIHKVSILSGHEVHFVLGLKQLVRRGITSQPGEIIVAGLGHYLSLLLLSKQVKCLVSWFLINSNVAGVANLVPIIDRCQGIVFLLQKLRLDPRHSSLALMHTQPLIDQVGQSSLFFSLRLSSGCYCLLRQWMMQFDFVQ